MKPYRERSEDTPTCDSANCFAKYQRQQKGRVLSDPAKAARLEAPVREACADATYEGATVDAGGVIARIRALPSGMRS